MWPGAAAKARSALPISPGFHRDEAMRLGLEGEPSTVRLGQGNVGIGIMGRFVEHSLTAL